MARMYQGILGGLSGKIGNVVGSSWKGIPVLKTKPLSVANPQTAAQVAQRTSMTAVTTYASLINSTVIKPLWDRFASKMSGYNAFVSANIQYFTNLQTAIWANVVVSKGKMAAVAIDDAIVDASAMVMTLTYASTLPDAYSTSGDLVYAVCIDPTHSTAIGEGGASTRADGQVDLSLIKAPTVGSTVHCYLAFKRIDGTIVSDSSYHVAVVVA